MLTYVPKREKTVRKDKFGQDYTSDQPEPKGVDKVFTSTKEHENYLQLEIENMRKKGGI